MFGGFEIFNSGDSWQQNIIYLKVSTNQITCSYKLIIRFNPRFFETPNMLKEVCHVKTDRL